MADWETPITPEGGDLYVLGKGEVYFQTIQDGAENPKPEDGGFLFMGNAPSFTFNTTTENLDHFSSRAGVNEKDASVETSRTHMSTLTLDSMDDENIALFMGGTSEKMTQAASANFTQTDVFRVKKLGEMFQIGVSEDVPWGARNILSAANTPITHSAVNQGKVAAGADAPAPANVAQDVGAGAVEIDADRGLVYVKKEQPQQDPIGFTNAMDTYIKVTYGFGAVNYNIIKSGEQSIQGRLHYIERNARGPNRFVLFPKIVVRPNGDLPFISNEWRQFELSIEILKPTRSEAVIFTDKPLV